VNDLSRERGPALFDDDAVAFTLEQLLGARACIHSLQRVDCAACVAHTLWYRGRIAGLREVAGLLTSNAAVVEALRAVVIAAEQKAPDGFYNDRLADRD
jgi:hypothetical protein